MAASAIAVCAPVVSAGRPAALRLQRSARPFHRPTMPLRRPAPRRQATSFLPAAIFALKLLASALAGAVIPMLLWQDWTPVAPATSTAEGFGTFYPERRETRVYRSVPRL